MPKDQKEEKRPDDLQGTQTTQLRVMIEEDAHGNLDIVHECVIKGTTTLVPMRPSHLAGQLLAAAGIVLAKSYKKLTLVSEDKTATEVKE